MNMYKEASREIEIYDNVDTIVVGAGVAGCVEAIKEARKGKKVVLVEQYAVLGGYLTSGGHPKMKNDILKNCDDKVLLEVFEKIVADKGTRYSNFADLQNDAVADFLVDPEVVNVILMEMCIEAKVELNLLTVFCDAIVENNAVKGVVLQNKAGRYAIMAKEVVDATGNAKVINAAGAEVENDPKYEDAQKYGLPTRIGHVDLDKFVEFVTTADTKNNEDFDNWLQRKTGKTLDELKADDYYKYFVNASTYDGKAYDNDLQAEYKKMFAEEGRIYNVGIQFFKDVIKRADENGDLDFEPVFQNITLRFNLEGVSAEKWRHGEVVANLVATKEAFLELDTTGEADLERIARERALEVTKTLKKYVPGFEKAYLISTATKTYSPNTRVVKNCELSGVKQVELALM